MQMIAVMNHRKGGRGTRKGEGEEINQTIISHLCQHGYLITVIEEDNDVSQNVKPPAIQINR